MDPQDHQNSPFHGQPVENYTMPFLVVFGVLIWIALVAIWGFFGMIGALVAGFAADRAIPQR